MKASEIAELWMEYEANSSPEAKFVKDLDKVWALVIYLFYFTDYQGFLSGVITSFVL